MITTSIDCSGTPDLDIIIVTFNNANIVGQALATIGPAVEALRTRVQVIDNCSTDNTINIVVAQFPALELIRIPRNIGFAAANNLGLRLATAPYILLLNSDVEVMSGSIQAMVDSMKNNERIGIVGCKLLNCNGTLQYSCRRFPTIGSVLGETRLLGSQFGFRKHYARYLMADWDHRTTRHVDYVCGASFLIRKSALDQVGLFDERYFMYAEEADLCRRFWDHGWGVLYDPDAMMIHYGGMSSDRIRIEMDSELIRSRWIFFKKWYGFIPALAYLFIAVIKQLATRGGIVSTLWRQR